MGWIMVIAMVVSAAVSAASSYYAGVESKNQSKRQSQMLEADKNRRQKEIARKTKKMAAGQRASFLSSSISLTGGGTADSVLGETYDFGAEDIKNVGEAYTNQQEAVLAKGRSDYNMGLLSATTAVATGVAGVAGAGSPSSLTAGSMGSPGAVNPPTASQLLRPGATTVIKP